MPQPNLSHLAIFVAVARHLSFQRAAAETNLSTSAVSHAIRNLEERLGVGLFNRTTRSVNLTEAGEHLLARLQPMLRDVGEAIDEMNSFRDRPSGRLRINTSRAAAHIVIVPLMARFLARFPGINLEVVDEEGLIDIVATGFDAGLRFPESVPEDMIAVDLGLTSSFAVIVAQDWLDRNGPLRHPGDLLAHECVRYRYRSGRVPKWEFENAGEIVEIDVPGRITVGDQDLALAAAREGIGPAFLLEDAARADLAAGSLVRVLEDWCPPFPGPVIYYPRQRRASAALRAFIDMARQEL